MKKLSSADLTVAQLEALVEKIGGHEHAIDFINNNNLVVTRSWHEYGRVIYFTVESDGTAGPQWIKRLTKKGFTVSRSARKILRSSAFKPTKQIVYKIVAFRGELFGNQNLTKEFLDKEVLYQGEQFPTKVCEVPTMEVGCLIREKFSDEDLKEMGLERMFIMHRPAKTSRYFRFLLLTIPSQGDGFLSPCYSSLDTSGYKKRGGRNTWRNNTSYVYVTSHYLR
jgi:hypothetical protein